MGWNRQTNSTTQIRVCIWKKKERKRRNKQTYELREQFCINKYYAEDVMEWTNLRDALQLPSKTPFLHRLNENERTSKTQTKPTKFK